MRSVKHVQRRGMCIGFLWGVGGQKEGDCLEDLGIDGKIALKEILKKQDGHGLESSGSGNRQEADSCHTVQNLQFP